ncbi:hypothetical protein JTE90_021664 [Oedothorax gibbosus]|uniref:glutathione transferase n=1 Tax=Oedothorax gibbosus TaxID=931172 RepID=A0AAV6VRN7_9ARAC|nr:hypothetical protein JTE90_021664 [Oedothorax gibbosus]
MVKPVFAYWDVRGLGQPSRYLLHYKNVDFEDKRYQIEENQENWLSEKFTLGLDFPNLPYYIDDKVKLTQSTTIIRYLGQKHGLDGKTEEDRLRVSLAEQQIVDFRTSFGLLCYNPEFEKMKVDYVAKVPVQLKLVSDFLGDRKFLAGDYITYVDFMAYDVFEYFRYLIPTVLDDFPTLKAYQSRIRQLPQLQAYFNSATYRRWPIFSPHAKFGGSGPEPEIK